MQSPGEHHGSARVSPSPRAPAVASDRAPPTAAARQPTRPADTYPKQSHTEASLLRQRLERGSPATRHLGAAQPANT